MLTIEEIKKELDAGREVELECIDTEGFVKQGIRHIRESTLESSLIVDYITSYGSGLHVKIKDLNSSIPVGSLKYFRIKRPAPTFDDLIAVAVKAVRDKVIYQFNFTKAIAGNDLLEVFETSLQKTNNTSHFFNDDIERIKEGIDFINSLYTETFVIEGEECFNKIEKFPESIIMKNGESLNKWDYDRIGVNDREFMLKILKGATVTQKREK